MYDITDPESFNHLDNYLNKIKEYVVEDVPIILAANKCDLVENRKVSYAEGKNYAEIKGLKFIEVCAKTSINIEELFEMITRENIKKINNTFKVLNPE